MSDLSLSPSLGVVNGVVRTTSLKVAEHFGKRHDTVLRAIRNLECSDDFRLRNFVECSRINEMANGKREPYFEMTRDGFTFAAMGFTGKEAARWKEAYITAFNRMESELLQQAATRNAIKSLESPTLTASEQQTLSEIVARRANECADIGKAKAEIWSRVHRKFRVAKYNQLPRELLADAIAYVMQMNIKAPAMPAPERTAYADNPSYSYAREQLDSLGDWGRRALPPAVQTEFFAVTKELERSLIRGWTEMDEAVMHMAVSMAMLKRWKMAH